jgi:hypothetical protein
MIRQLTEVQPRRNSSGSLPPFGGNILPKSMI